MSPNPNERERIRVGIDRLLNDQAKFSNGALTIVALAQEAQVPRNALTQRHTDLRNEFYELVKAHGATPDVETRLRAEITKLKKTIANKNDELRQLRTDVPALVRALNHAGNQQLRETLANPDGNVIPIRGWRSSDSSTPGGA